MDVRCTETYMFTDGGARTPDRGGIFIVHDQKQTFPAGSGYRSDETDPNSIFCIANIVLLLSPTKATNT